MKVGEIRFSHDKRRCLRILEVCTKSNRCSITWIRTIKDLDIVINDYRIYHSNQSIDEIIQGYPIVRRYYNTPLFKAINT